jgi:hypothetical protein
MATLSAAQFGVALKIVKRPGRSQMQFLRAHFKAPGRAATATQLAEKAGYVDHRGINLWYGRLATEIGQLVGRPDAKLSLLVEFVRPESLTNREWILVMRPEFAEALKRAQWVG